MILRHFPMIVILSLLPIPYNDLTIQFTSDEINQTQCFEAIKKFPDKYYEEMKFIRFYPKGALWKRFRGWYFWGGRILLFNGCDYNGTKTLAHELAHHQQYLHGERLYLLKTHSGNFSEYNKELRRLVK